MDVCFLPDSDAARPVTRRLFEYGYSCNVRHESGRPWIIGSWNDHELHEANVPGMRVALLGIVKPIGCSLVQAVGGLRAFSDADDLYERVAGSYITALASAESVRVHGTLSGVHELYYAEIDGAVVAANKSDMLGALKGLGISERMMPAILLAPRAPWPVSEKTLWNEVHHVPTTDSVEFGPDGRVRLAPRWRVPGAREPLREIAPRLRAALRASVESRAGAASILGADLSGGMDSTTLAFYADQSTDDLVTVRQNAYDRTNDDAYWAELAQTHMRSRNHIRIAPEDTPAWYSDWQLEADDDMGFPYPAVRTLGLHRRLSERLMEKGVTVHLTGLGGDELFSTSFVHLHSLFHDSPFRALRPARGMQAIARWKTYATFRSLMKSTSHAEWLRGQVAHLRDEVCTGPGLYWEPEPRMPPWATEEAVQATAKLIAEAASALDARAPGAEPVDFEMMTLVRADGTLIRRMSRAGERVGVKFEAPYLDDAVVDLAFRTRLQDRVAHGVFKPVLRAAAPPGFPERLFARRSKGDYSAEAYKGLQRNGVSMLEVFRDGTILESMGLIDVKSFLDFLSGIHPNTQPLRFLDATLGAEMWLRNVKRI